LMLAVLGLSALTTAVSSSKTEADDTAPSENVRSPVVESIDAWGRPIDGMDSANSFDVQE